MADTSQMEVPPQTNGLSDGMDDDERLKMRPADIDADVKEMERRKRVDMIMNSKLFREELERIIETQLKDGAGTSGLMQQISDMMGVSKNAGHVFKNSNCVVPINDIRGIEAMGYAKGEKILRCKLAAVYRLIDLYGWSQGCRTLITARLNQDEEHFLVNPYGMLFHEITASSLIKVDMQGNVVEQGTTNFSVNITAFSLHAAIHSSRPDIKCIIHVHTPSVVAISALKCGLLPLSEESVVIGDISTHSHPGGVLSIEEIEKIARNLGPNNKILLLTNQGAVCCGETIEEAFFTARNTVLACESQLKLMPMGIDNLVLISDEQRKKLYEAAHKAPESSPRPDQPSILEGKVERKWRVGGIEFEALMRMLDNAGFRTGYIYRHPLVKGEPPKPRNDVEVPPAVSSLGYLLEEEELYRQGLWKKLEGGRKGHDRTRWLNSPNVYQKVEILETGTPDPKKITKWVADGSPTHSSTPVKIENALQFVPKNTNPKEFKQLQQQIKDYRRADKISAGPQSHILEGVTWEEAKKMQDATVTQTGDQVVLMGAASKGIIQRGFQHNATMYKSPYAKNPFDSITDEELDEYKRVVERKARGEFDDTTDYSESEGLSSAQINKRISDIRSPTSVTSETEEESRDEPQVLRIETTQAPKPSQPEIVMSDDDVFLDNTQEIIVEHFKVSAVEQSPVSRVSVNSTRSMKVVRAYRHPTSIRNYYRTTSFSGLPKGSYLLPNPRHFHLAHYTNINKPMRPHFINLISGGRYSSFNPNLPHHISNNWDNNIRPTVTINLANSRTITLNISLQTLREFIYPFATALNLSNLTDSKTASCQTSYHVDQKVSITEITNGNNKNMNRDTSSESNTSSEEISEFESSILKTMRDSMLSEPNFNDIYTDFDSTQTIIDQKIVKNENEHFVIEASDLQAIKVTKNVSLGGGDTTETIYQTENEEVKAQSLMFDNNEDFTEFEGSGYEASGELTSTVSVLETNSTRIDDDQDLLTKHRLEEIPETNIKPSPNTEHLNINDVLGMADVVTDRILEMAQDYSLFEEVVKETLSLFKELPFPYDIYKVTDTHIAQKILEPKNEMRDQEINKNTNENIDLKFTHSKDERSFELESCVDSPNMDIGNLQYEIEPKESHVVESLQFESKSEFNENKQKSEVIQNGSNEVIEMHAIVTPHQYTTSINTDGNTLQAQTVDASNKHTLPCELARFPSTEIEETLKRKEYINITPKTAVLQDNISETQASVRSYIENSTALKQLGFEVEDNEETLMNTPLIIPRDKDNYRIHCNTDNLNINIEPAEINTENADEAIHIETCQNNVVKITPNVDDISVGDQQTEKSCHMAPLEYQIQFTVGALPAEEGVKENIDKHVTYEDEKYVQIENSQCKVIDNTKSIQQEVENDDLNFQEPLRKENVIPEITKDDLPIDNINTIECDEGFGATESEYDIKQDVTKFPQFNIVENTQTKIPRDGTESTNTDVQDLTSTLVDENKVKETPLTSEIISSTDTSDTQNYLTADEESHELSKEKTGQIASEDSSDLEDYEIIEFDDDTNMENLSYFLDQIVQHEEDNKAEIMRLGSNMNEMNILENQQQVDDIIPALSENVVVGMDNFTNEKNDAEGNVIQRKNIDIVSLNMLENIAEKHNIERNSSPPDSFDEGISDCKTAVTESTTANFSSEFDEKVIEMAEVVFEYIIKQCYEVTDLVLFPEVLYDENVIKMFLKLKELYVKYYSDISDADKNELRMNMTNYILKKLEHTSPACYEEGESSGNISDKLFTISEFISDIFDKFFDEYIDSNEFSDSWSGFSSLLAEKQVCHSTPEDKTFSENADVKKSKIKEKKNAKPTTPSKTNSKPEDLTAFQKKKSQSGSEVYWISINRSPKNEEDTTPRKAVVINVDDIPLKPPDDLTPSKNRNLKRPLSPILEEAKCNLLNEFQENALRPQSSVLSMHTENYEYKDTTDFLAGGDYMQFDKPESDMILVNEATFFRGHAANNAYYIQSSSVTFHPDLKQMKHNNNNVEGCIGDDEGNWMGFEKAKF